MILTAMLYGISIAQTAYISSCTASCDQCPPVARVTYRANPANNVVIRELVVLGSPERQAVEAQENCKVVDSQNWVCHWAAKSAQGPSTTQSAINGKVRIVSDGQTTCRYEKTPFGFELRP